MEYTIDNGTLAVTVSTRGAELQSVKFNGKERLWQNETGEWAGHSPVLFPYCGAFGVKVDGKIYEAPAHGLCKKTEFAFVEKGENYLTFAFASTEETRKVFPYDFLFKVSYKIEGATLFVTYEVDNTGDRELPFSCGGHESFILDGDVDEYKLVFAEEETFVHRPHGDDAMLTGESVVLGTGKELVIPREILLGGNTVILENIRSDSLKLCTLSGEEKAFVEFEGFPHLLLWRPSGRAKMVCIEPWHNLPDLTGTEPCELKDKPDMTLLPAGESKKIVRKIEYK